MSGFHGKIESNNVDGQVVFNLMDMGSTNKTWLRLSNEGTKSDLFKLNYGDIIKIGSTVMQIKKPDSKMIN